MKPSTRIVATVDLLLILPAAFFMTALVVRNLQPLLPALAAQRIVMWYAGQMWTLWVLLLALPLIVLVTGGATLLRGARLGPPNTPPRSLSMFRASPARLFVAAATLAAAAILVIVVLHVLAN
jgi:hypothetical protein